MKKSNQRGSVFSLLLRNYILFTLVLVLVLFLLFSGFMYHLREIVSNTSFTQEEANIQMQSNVNNHTSIEQKNAAMYSLWLFIASFFLIYSVLLLLFIHLLNNKIKKPLQLFCHELNTFEYRKNQHEYHGPKEFVEIFDSFNALSKRLKYSEEERAKLEADKQKMLADISHDLRTPISVVQGYAKALHDGIIPPEQQMLYLEIIEQKASKLNELITTFYEYSKMEHPDYTLNLVPMDICNTLRDYVADRYAELEFAGFIIEVNIPEEHIFCNLDVSAFRRALDNIVNNSISHNPKGTTIFFSLMSKDNKIQILIGDNGDGIPVEIQKNIFTPFVVGEVSRSKQSSGLGLSITKKIIEAHHGKIKLLNTEKSKGTTFEILLSIIH